MSDTFAVREFTNSQKLCILQGECRRLSEELRKALQCVEAACGANESLNRRIRRLEWIQGIYE